MAGVKEIRASFEILESKRPLAGDVTISRGDIVAPEVVLINNDVVGPSPIVFEKVDFCEANRSGFLLTDGMQHPGRLLGEGTFGEACGVLFWNR